MDGLIKDRFTMLAALGAGVVVGVSGIYLYHKSTKRIVKELHHINSTINKLRSEIESLKVTSPKAPSQQDDSTRKSRSSRKTKSEKSLLSEPVFTSTYCTSDEEEEYYDISDAEEGEYEDSSLPPLPIDQSQGYASISSYPRNEEETLEGSIKGYPSKDKEAKYVPSSLKGSRPRVHFDLIDEMLDSSSLAKDEVFHKLKGMKNERGDDPEYLWRMAKATHLMSLSAKRNMDQEKMKELAFEAYDYAKVAMALIDNNPEVHKWYAITLGSLSEYVSTQEKLNNGLKFKEHVEIALSLKKDDPSLYHMLGRWYFEVASLSWFERKAASTLFSAVPEASYPDAIAPLLKAKKLKPDWKENLLFLAKAYFGNREYTEGLACIEEALSLPEDGEDPAVWQELADLRDKYEAYG